MDHRQLTAGERCPILLLVGAVTEDRFTITSVCDLLGFRVIAVRRLAAHAVRTLADHPVSLVICKEQMLDGQWQDLFLEVRRVQPNSHMVVIADETSGRLHSEVYRMGGCGVLLRPLRLSSIDRLLQLVIWEAAESLVSQV